MWSPDCRETAASAERAISDFGRERAFSCTANSLNNLLNLAVDSDHRRVAEGFLLMPQTFCTWALIRLFKTHKRQPRVIWHTLSVFCLVHHWCVYFRLAHLFACRFLQRPSVFALPDGTGARSFIPASVGNFVKCALRETDALKEVSSALPSGVPSPVPLIPVFQSLEPGLRFRAARGTSGRQFC